jgi:hypothetical protein
VSGGMIDFAQNHPVAAFFIVWVMAWAVTRPFYYAFMAYNRRLRSRNIAAHGWPTAPIDADGDVVYEKKDQS